MKIMKNKPGQRSPDDPKIEIDPVQPFSPREQFDSDKISIVDKYKIDKDEEKSPLGRKSSLKNGHKRYKLKMPSRISNPQNNQPIKTTNTPETCPPSNPNPTKLIKLSLKKPKERVAGHKHHAPRIIIPKIECLNDKTLKTPNAENGSNRSHKHGSININLNIDSPKALNRREEAPIPDLSQAPPKITFNNFNSVLHTHTNSRKLSSVPADNPPENPPSPSFKLQPIQDKPSLNTNLLSLALGSSSPSQNLRRKSADKDKASQHKQPSDIIIPVSKENGQKGEKGENGGQAPKKRASIKHKTYTPCMNRELMMCPRGGVLEAEPGMKNTYRAQSKYHMFLAKMKIKENNDIRAKLNLQQEDKIDWGEGDRDKERASLSPVREDRAEDRESPELKLNFKMGQGSFGSVFEGYDKLLKKNVAIKVFEKAKVRREGAQRMRVVEEELEIMRKLGKHQHLCEFYRLVQDRKKVGFS